MPLEIVTDFMAVLSLNKSSPNLETVIFLMELGTVTYEAPPVYLVSFTVPLLRTE